MTLMKFQTEVKQVLGTPDQGAWSQVHHFIPNQEEKFLKRGELILLVSLGEIDEEQPTASVGREIISRFHEEYYGSLDKKPMAALEEAVNKVAKEKSQYFDKPEEISLISLALWKNIAYLVVYHRGKILLRRQGKTVDLVQTENGQPISASGFIQPGDIFILGTTDFFEKMPQTMIPSGIATEDIERMSEIWGPVVHAREDQGRLGVVMIEIGAEEKKIEFVSADMEDKPKKIKKKPKLKLPKIKFGWLTGFFKKISGLSIAIGFLALLGISIFFGWKKRRDQKRLDQVSVLSTQVEEKISNANSIRNLDPEESINLLNQAGEINQELKAYSPAQANTYKQRIEEIKSNLGEKALSPEMFYDLHLVAEGIEISSVYTADQQATILDTKGKRLISVNLSDKSAEIVAGGEPLSQSGLVVTSTDRNYIVTDNIYWIDDEEVEELIDLEDDYEPQSADGWLGSLYLLDRGQEEIWKFPSITGGLGDARPWLNSKSGLDFDQLVDMAIDSNIWLLSKNGQIYKYLSGNRQDLEMETPSGIGEARYLALADEAERLALWDKGSKIVWLFSKQGTFLARQPVEMESVRGLAISSDGTEVFLFGADKIYRVEFQL